MQESCVIIIKMKKKNFVVGMPCGNRVHPSLVQFIVENKIDKVIIEQGYWLIKNRNRIIKKFLEEYNEDYLIFIDSDTVPRIEWIELVIKSKFDVVGIPYPMRKLNVSCINPNTNKWYSFEEYAEFVDQYRFIETKLIDAGCIIIHRRVLEQIKEPWWENPPEDYIVTEALNFCYKIQTKGFRIYSLIGALCDHYKENTNLADFVIKKEKKQIPKIIHQIWIGSKKVPYERWRQRIREMHPDWQYILWDEKMLLKEEMISKKIFNVMMKKSNKKSRKEASKYEKMRQVKSPYIKMSDIARYNILKKYGGVYIDIDMICLKPLEDLIEGNEFFAGFEGEGRVSGLIGNSIIGCIPNHKVVRRCCKRLRNIPEEVLAKDAVFVTGPVLFTEEIAKCDNITIFRHRVFYPILREEDVKKEFRKKNNPLFKESYFIHPWGLDHEIDGFNELNINGGK